MFDDSTGTFFQLASLITSTKGCGVNVHVTQDEPNQMAAERILSGCRNLPLQSVSVNLSSIVQYNIG
jgi:hypothetical protein